MPRTPDLPLEGGCQCGRVRFSIHRRPLTLYCCHCTECQRQSSSAFGMSLRVERAGLEIDWNVMTAREVSGFFCPACGTRLVHARPAGETVNIKAGALDHTAWLRPVGHLWTRSRQPWVQIPADALDYPGQPESYDELIDAWRRART